MKDDITPIPSEKDPGGANRLRPPFLVKREKKKKPKPKKIKSKPKRAKPAKKRKPKISEAEKRVSKAKQRYRREKLKEQEYKNRRGDLVFFWVMISFLIIGSVLAAGYYYLTKKRQLPVIEAPIEETAEIAEAPTGQTDYFLFLSATEDRAAIYKDYLGTQQRETIVSFTPPAEVSDIDGDWDKDHCYGFIDQKGVEIYNADKKSKSILAPNQGDREYFKVKFAKSGNIATLYRKNNQVFLEIYSSSLSQIGSKRRVTDFDWTKKSLGSFILVNRGKDQYQFSLYRQKEERFVQFFTDYFGPTRYPIAFAFSPKEDNVAFLLRDEEGNQPKVVLGIGNIAREQISKVAELLYLEAGVEDSEITNPTLIWDKKEDFIYASLNNRIFKVDITANEAKELSLGFHGTAQFLSPDRTELYIRKADESTTTNQPESAVIYNFSQKKVTFSSPISQIVKFIGSQYFKEE